MATRLVTRTHIAIALIIMLLIFAHTINPEAMVRMCSRFELDR
jgi:hypothetical protein